MYSEVIGLWKCWKIVRFPNKLMISIKKVSNHQSEKCSRLWSTYVKLYRNFQESVYLSIFFLFKYNSALLRQERWKICRKTNAVEFKLRCIYEPREEILDEFWGQCASNASGFHRKMPKIILCTAVRSI